MFGHVAGPISDKNGILDDLELQVDPTPLSKEEEIGLSLFIRQLKEKTVETANPVKQNLRSKAAQM
jgi:hypothetical protein